MQRNFVETQLLLPRSVVSGLSPGPKISQHSSSKESERGLLCAHTYTVYKYTLRMNQGALLLRPKLQHFPPSFFQTCRHVYCTCAGWGRDVFWHRWWQWELYNESRAAWPHCYLFHYLNNGSSTAGFMLLLEPLLLFRTDFWNWNFFCVFTGTPEVVHCGAMIRDPGCRCTQSDLCTNGSKTYWSSWLYNNLSCRRSRPSSWSLPPSPPRPVPALPSSCSSSAILLSWSDWGRSWGPGACFTMDASALKGSWGWTPLWASNTWTASSRRCWDSLHLCQVPTEQPRRRLNLM